MTDYLTVLGRLQQRQSGETTQADTDPNPSPHDPD
jgi:hypothetical protein